MTFVPDVVSAQRTAKDWREAISIVGELYEEAGIATKEYTEAMIKGVEDFGPYMVFIPGIAMPHAKATSGVLKAGTAVVTLATPVKFGSKNNDPVDFLISFASENTDGHMEKIQELADVLGQQELIEKARQASSDVQLMEVFTQ
ncbi:PTS sugar transporter subunit IIA [Rothia sp. P7181]|uniref:PTS sugar transporter subunit IIA n=1 Tax=Rothia sp. P7181 TaxID=3402663 RepID=UPI003AD9DF49